VSGNVLQFPDGGAPLTLCHRLDGILAIFQAIEAGELLAAGPDCPIAQLHHRTALSLLTIAERELTALRTEVGAQRNAI